MKQTQEYTVTLTTLGPLHVGGLDDPLGAEDNPVAMIGGRPCIPGPTLKGAFRAEMERFLVATGNEKLRPCLTSTLPSPAEQALTSGETAFYRPRPCALRVRATDRGQRTDAGANKQGEEAQESICPACYVLGAMGLVGFVSVPFLMPVGDVKPESLYSSRIDRVTGTVVGGNRSYQVIVPGAQFKGKMEVLFEDKVLGWSFGKKRPVRTPAGDALEVDQWLDDAGALGSTQEELLQKLVLERLTAIDVIGGYRSKGFGAVKIEVQEG